MYVHDNARSSILLQCFLSTWLAGVLSNAPLFFSVLNTGASSNLYRMTNPTTAITAPITKGILHPQLINAGLASEALKSEKVNEASTNPIGTGVCAQLVQNDLHFDLAANSDTHVAAPPNSPPVPNPNMTRKTTIKTGARTPIVTKLGVRAMPSIPIPIATSVRISVGFLPLLSPRWPNTYAPTGFVRKTLPNAEIERAEAATGLLDGKNTAGQTSPAAKEPMK